MKGLNVVILAAGKGKRMASKRPKVLHEVMGRPMIHYVIERAIGLAPERIVVVLGSKREEVEESIRGFEVDVAVQEEQKGTAHALLSAEDALKNGDCLVLYGDVPLIESSTLEGFIRFYEKDKTITFMTTDLDDPSGYGRVMMKGDTITEIIEDIEATEEQRKIKRVNTGICIIPEGMFHLIHSIRPTNKKGEYYLTDICKVARERGIRVRGYNHMPPTDVLGINTRAELLLANNIMRERILERHIKMA